MLFKYPVPKHKNCSEKGERNLKGKCHLIHTGNVQTAKEIELTSRKDTDQKGR